MATKTVTIREAARCLGLTYHRVLWLILRRALRGWQVGGRYSTWRVSRASVERYAREHADA